MNVGEILAAVAYLGTGAGVSSVVTAVIASRSGKSEARAHAADMIANAAGSLAERLDKMNAHLEDENRHLRIAVINLTDAIDQMIPMLTGPPEIIDKVRAATSAAKLAI